MAYANPNSQRKSPELTRKNALRQIKRISKAAFRNALFHFPYSAKKYLAKKYIDQATKFLLPAEQLEKCEANPECRAEIIEAHKRKHPKQAEKCSRLIQAVIRDRRYNMDGSALLHLDMEYAFFAYGFLPKEYAYFHLAEKDMRLFVSETERKCAKQTMNDFTQSVFADKGKVYDFFKQWYKRDAVSLERKSDYRKYLDFVSAHPIYVVKIVNASMGKGVWLETATDDHRSDFLNILRHGKTLVEELIVQSEKMNCFNASSVNTVRIASYLTREGVNLAHGFMRTGRAGSFVDNGGSGGILALVDVKQGKIVSDGVDEFGNKYITHPDSGVQYDGYVLPDWKKALEITQDASLLFREMKYKSFDLAYTDNGWVIVEINPSGEYVFQACKQQGVKEELRSIMKSMDLICPYDMR